MRVSELIKALEDDLSKNGDRDVKYFDGYWNAYFEVVGISDSGDGNNGKFLELELGDLRNEDK